MLDLRKTLTLVTNLFRDNNIAHALIGGFALAIHGVNRATVDIDFLADGSKKDKIVNLMSQNGFKLNFSSEEVLQFTGVGFVDVLLANRPISKQMLKDAEVESKLALYVLKVEDLIGLKIQAYTNDPSREFQDKADIQSLIAKHQKLNWSKIRTYADLFGEWNTIDNLRKQNDT